MPLEPPRCLTGFVARPVADPGVELDALVDEWPNRFFSLSCACGNESFRVRSFFSPDDLSGKDLAYGPIVLRCSGCGDARTCFDPAADGYDVAIDHFPAPGPYNGRLGDYGCQTCAADTFLLVTRFQYPANVIDSPGELVSTGFVESRELFSYFTLIGTCSGCAAMHTISSVECA